MDITFKTPEGNFNDRVCAVIIHDGRLLAMHDGRAPYFYLPGGRVRLHEASADALRRELREELGIEARIIRPLWLDESFFTEDVTGERFHELCLYYLVDPADLGARGDIFQQADASNGRVNTFEWLAFERVRMEYLYPDFIKREIDRLPESLALITHRNK